MLEESLRRLKTDRLDLWQVHQILTDAEADSIFIPDGVLAAIEQARKQGKIRYCGFTGHAKPEVLLRVLAHRYPFDSVQMPLSVFDAHEGGFQKLVLPEAQKQGLAPLAMKTLGGNAKPIKDGLVTSEECLRYALSLPVTTVVSGIDTMEWLQKNARVAANFKPLAPQEMAELAQRCSSKKEYEYYRRWAYYDGGPPHALYA
jgi:aryl-alcohol dehydrogenase-like predicted oxidoreductase